MAGRFKADGCECLGGFIVFLVGLLSDIEDRRRDRSLNSEMIHRPGLDPIASVAKVPDKRVVGGAPLSAVEPDFESFEIRSQRLQRNSNLSALNYETEGCLTDREIGINRRIGRHRAHMPLGSVTELILHDEHAGVIKSAVHQVVVRDKADESILIEFVGMHREITESGKVSEHDGQVGLRVSFPLLPTTNVRLVPPL